jgi:hypothetical protein
LARIFKGVEGLDVKKLFKSFTASLAKWRFETIWDVFTQLLERRDFCERHFKASILGKTYDPQMVQDVVAACAWPDLWTWMAAVHEHVVAPLECIRRWGMKCDCCEDQREANPKMKPKCPRASMRLPRAYAYIQEQARDLLSKSRQLKSTDIPCLWVLFEVRRMMTKAATILLMKFKYMGSVPWLFANCDVADVARECLLQIRSKPIDKHESLTVHMTLHEESLENVANGGAPSDELLCEIKALRNVPLDESPGEGFHRASHVAQNRGSCTRLPYVKASLRFKENITRVKQFMKKHPKLGPRVVRYEFQNFKRVAQGKPESAHRSARQTDACFFNKVYRIDQAFFDWATVVDGGVGLATDTLKPDAISSTRREYLQCVLSNYNYFSMPAEVAEPSAEGAAQTVTLGAYRYRTGMVILFCF